MADSRRCPTCGETIAANAPRGLCPKCLMAMVLKDNSVPSAFGAPSGETLWIDPATTGAKSVLLKRSTIALEGQIGEKLELDSTQALLDYTTLRLLLS